MKRSYAVPLSLALLLTLPMLNPTSANAEPGPVMPGPVMPAPAVPGPVMPGATAPVPVTPAPAATGPSLMGYQQSTSYVIQRALSQRGVPFLYGGGNAAGPTRGTGLKANIVGFDASGLIQYAYAGAGIKMPRTSGEQCNVGRKVPLSQAKPGDLMCYGPAGTQSVAMYLGNGQMIEATEPTVTVSPARTSGMVPYLTRILES
jgi:cell wall-associated NlpC family hydrolase